MNIVSAQEAISIIKSNQRVFVQGSAATPQFLLSHLAENYKQLKNVEIVSVSTLGELKLAEPAFKESFFINSLFVSANVRQAVNGDNGDYIPVFLSEINQLFDRNILPIDVAIIHISPPDKHGFCSLGVSVDVAKSAVKNAKKVIAQINPSMPRTHGDGIIHISQVDAGVEVNELLPEVDYRSKIGSTETKIAKNIAALIPDRATLQTGIGSIPDAVLQELSNHKDLGVHTEMFSNGVIDLIKKGAITNKYKKKHRNKVVSTFAIGNKEMYDFIDDNPQFNFLEASYVNDGAIIRQNPNTVAINSAIEIDLTGQVCADTIGTYQFSGVGGQMDFIRGASLSEGGIPIIAIGSTTKKGKSKIVPELTAGANVVTTRAHMHYVATEFGVVNLFGKNLRQRAEALRDIAHPDHQENLDKSITERFGTKLK